MKKIFAVAFMAMGLSSAFANTNIIVNDTIVCDSTKALPDTIIVDTTKTAGYAENDTIIDSTKTAEYVENDTIIDSTKTVGYAENDTIVTDSTKAGKVVTCDKACKKAIRALAAQMK